jgi:hypothetical protein
MKPLLACFTLVLSLAPWTVRAADSASAADSTPPPTGVTLERLKPIQVITELPTTAWNTLKFSFQRDSVPVWAGLIVSTALLYQYDSDIYESAMGQGRRWNLGNGDKTKTIIEAGPYPLLRLPSDTGSMMYFLGDGWTHFGIAGGFAAAGYFGEHTRAWNTSLELVHGMAVSTFFNQALKRSFGRECPNHRTADKRGVWRPFPSVKAYGQNTPRYDAFPTGHLMTATLTFTTIRQNYPEYSAIIWPIQIVWSTALGFEMVNNGVHWASDYPLGIAMGWAVARMAVKMGQHNQTVATAKNDGSQWTFFPSVSEQGDMLMGAMRAF